MRTLGTLVVIAGLLLGFGECEQAVGEDLPIINITEARANVQAIATAVSAYRASCGALPESMSALTRMTMVSGAPCGPMLDSIPNPPPGWMVYLYTVTDDTTFTVMSYSYDGTQSVSAP